MKASVLEYSIVWDESISRLVEEVAEAMASGWVPCGGIAVESWEAGSRYLQAMTRRVILAARHKSTKKS